MSPGRVVDEIEYIIENHDVSEFEIFDDIFNMDYNRVLEICAEIKRRGLKTSFSFPNGVRGDMLDEKILEELKSVGTYQMAFAVESGNSRIQKLIRKNIDLKKIKKNIAIASGLGIFTWGFFMMGFPTETRKEIWSTLRFAFSSRLHGAFFFQVVPHEGTQLASMCKAQADGRKVFVASDYSHGHGSLANVSAMELSFFQSLAYLVFFFDPRRILYIYNSRYATFPQLTGFALSFLNYAVVQKARLIFKNVVKRIVK